MSDRYRLWIVTNPHCSDPIEIEAKVRSREGMATWVLRLEELRLIVMAERSIEEEG